MALAAVPRLPHPIARLNLKKIFHDHREEFADAIFRVLDRAAYIGGEELTLFERNFAGWVGGLDYFAVGSGNGTDAITAAARALALPLGGEAIVPAMTSMATATGLVNAGFTIRLVDVAPGTWLMDTRQIEKTLSKKTQLLAPVHLYGQMAEMDRIRALADKHGLHILEDAAQAHGAQWKERNVGHWGDIATYSFYPENNLGAFGDAGAIISRHEKYISKARALGNQESSTEHESAQVGFNSRLDNIQAAILNVKLKYIDRWNEARRDVARQYRELLSGIPGMELPVELPASQHVYHSYVVQVEKRDDFMAFMKQRGIETSLHYPRALHQLPAFKAQFEGQTFPNAERTAAHGISLPMCPTLSPAAIERVAETVRSYFGG